MRRTTMIGVVLLLAGCATTQEGPLIMTEGRACRLTGVTPSSITVEYPPDLRDECVRVLTALGRINDQRRNGFFGDAAARQQFREVLDSPDGQAVRAMSPELERVIRQ